MTAPKPTPELRLFIRESLKRGSFFFSEGTMSFFDSKVHGGFYELHPENPYAGYFITSEKYDDESPRLYSVRFAQSPTEISTVSEFGEHETFEQAKAQIIEIMRREIKGNTSEHSL